MNQRSWLLTYSNLMTIFLVFFIILYVFSFLDAERFERVASSLQSEFGGAETTERLNRIMQRREEEELARFLDAFIDEEGIRSFAEVIVERDDIKVVFAEQIVFESGRAELKPDILPLLEKLAELLRKIPNEVIIEGHTDNIPISVSSRFSSNWELSLQRALSVIHYFTRIEGFSGRRFIPVGYGEYRPLVPNVSAENRTKNRRIEMIITRTEA